MDKRIYKYTLEITDEQVIVLPKDAEILTAQIQGDDLQLWALVNTDEHRKERRVIYIYGTGIPIEDWGGYLATVQTNGGKLVWHIVVKNR